MALFVTERQTTKTWYELSGELSANEIFPKILANSSSTNEVIEDTKTEPEEEDGKYDGFHAVRDAMKEEIEEFTKCSIAKFHEEALTAAKTMLLALKPGQTLMQRDFEGAEGEILVEAASTLGIPMPWDPIEAAQIDARRAAYTVERQQAREREELRQRQLLEVLPKAAELLKTGHKPSDVTATFPNFAGQIGNLVGKLRQQGVQIAH